MLRRNFLARIAVSATAALRGSYGTPCIASDRALVYPGAAAKRERIAVSTWSLHKYFRATRRTDSNAPGEMVTLPEFPEIIVSRFGVHHLEFCAVHFESAEPSYVQKIKGALTRARCAVVNLVLDIKECGARGTFSDPDPQKRAVAVSAVKHWVDVAQELGARSVRVDPGNPDLPDMTRTADSYEQVARYAQRRGLGVIVENVHEFGTQHPEEIAELIHLVSPVRIGALPDFANFPDQAARDRGLKMLFPYAQTVCHAKGQEFDAHGVEQTFDFPKAMETARNAGFKGIYSIEFNGSGDPFAGIQNTVNELLKYM